MTGNATVIYDASVLYPAPLRDLLMHLAQSDVVRARWNSCIHDEWMRSVLSKRADLRAEQLERTRQLMDAHVRDCLVDGFEHRIAGLVLPDPHDRHVLAAAIEAKAQHILTFNLKDFPPEALVPHQITARHPDDFLLELLNRVPRAVAAAAERHRTSLKSPSKSLPEYLATLERQGLDRSAKYLGQWFNQN